MIIFFALKFKFFLIKVSIPGELSVSVVIAKAGAHNKMLINVNVMKNFLDIGNSVKYFNGKRCFF